MSLRLSLPEHRSGGERGQPPPPIANIIVGLKALHAQVIPAKPTGPPSRRAFSAGFVSCRTAPQPRRCFGGSFAANCAPPVLACLPYFTRSPSFRLRWPACPGSPSSPSFRAGRPPLPPVGSPSLPLLTLPGHRFRVGFCLRFATPFSPPFTRASTHHLSIGRASAKRGTLALLIQNAIKLISPAEVSAGGRPAYRLRRREGRERQGLRRHWRWLSATLDRPAASYCQVAAGE